MVLPQMAGYPLFLNLEGQRCLVFGGGRVATRKVQALLKRGANVICLSKDFCEPLRKLANSKGARPLLKLMKRKKGAWPLLNGARVVIAATSDRNFNARVARACRRKKIWVNVVDEPKLCDFMVPAVVQRGPLQIAISTEGRSPLFSRRLREELEKVIPSSTGRLLERLGKIRKKLLRKK